MTELTTLSLSGKLKSHFEHIQRVEGHKNEEFSFLFADDSDKTAMTEVFEISRDCSF